MTAALVPPPPPVPTATRTHRLSTASRLTAVGELRELVAALLRTAGHRQLSESARVCTSELVTNVCRHTPAKLVHVEVTLADNWISVYVYDDRPRELPVPPERVPGIREGGLGLGLVDALADQWGVCLYGGMVPHSKAVWFKMVEGGRGMS
ncbi:ATP-binding protein [Streptomyces sp. BPTC-684]|nr:ATP-binding protein [Streptomyces sp. BPTC-684]WHM36328.1 ATP-binding protein [Streptomyces sp. BPTC-684]